MLVSNPPDSCLPHIHLLCMHEQDSSAFNDAFRGSGLQDKVTVEIHASTLQFVPPETNFDLVVSPANSYGRLDGGFDDAISRAFSPRGNYFGLTRVVQKQLYEEWRGFAPPGSCTLVRIPSEYERDSNNAWKTKYVALCPTMRVPQNTTWDREVVYECVWSLLCAIDRHNRHHHEQINSLLMTPLATGTGRVSAERWANQLTLALKHFIEARENSDKWSALEVEDIYQSVNEVRRTWDS